MAFYTITRANGSTITVTEATANSQTNVKLIGQNYTGYGSEIATNFLQMLENFAHTQDPVSNVNVAGDAAITGQLWYDSTVANPVLKLYNGAGWKEQANVSTQLGDAQSSTAGTNATLRWNDTLKSYVAEERVRISDAGSLLIDAAASGTNAVTFNHGGTNFTATFAGTTDFTISGLTGDLTVTGGRGLSVENGATALAIRAGGSSDINFTAASADTMNMPAGVKMVTAASTAARAGLNIPEAVAAPSAPADGDVWVTAAGNFYARLNGSTVDLAAAAGGTVTSSGAPLNNEVAVFTGGTDIDSDSTFTWDGTTMFATNVTGTNIGGIASANLIDRATPGTISGAPTLTAATTALTATLGDIRVQGGFGFVTNESTTSFAVRAKTTGNQIEFTHANTPDWVVTGLGRATFDNPVDVTSSGAESLRVVGDAATWSGADSYISFYDSNESQHGMLIGTTAADLSAGVVNARVGNLVLKASDTEVARFLTSTATFTTSGVTALVTRVASASGNTTSVGISDVDGDLHNAGYNETPTDDILNTSSITLDREHIGKFLTRTASISRTITLNNIATIPVGATVLVHNGSSGGTLTIAIGTITNLIWIDGSGTTPTTTLNRTLANNSVATLRKVNATDWQIWGNGIS